MKDIKQLMAIEENWKAYDQVNVVMDTSSRTDAIHHTGTLAHPSMVSEVNGVVTGS